MLVATAEGQNVALAQTFSNTIWHWYFSGGRRAQIAKSILWRLPSEQAVESEMGRFTFTHHA